MMYLVIFGLLCCITAEALPRNTMRKPPDVETNAMAIQSSGFVEDISPQTPRLQMRRVKSLDATAIDSLGAVHLISKGGVVGDAGGAIPEALHNTEDEDELANQMKEHETVLAMFASKTGAPPGGNDPGDVMHATCPSNEHCEECTMCLMQQVQTSDKCSNGLNSSETNCLNLGTRDKGCFAHLKDTCARKVTDTGCFLDILCRHPCICETWKSHWCEDRPVDQMQGSNYSSCTAFVAHVAEEKEEESEENSAGFSPDVGGESEENSAGFSPDVGGESEENSAGFSPDESSSSPTISRKPRGPAIVSSKRRGGMSNLEARVRENAGKSTGALDVSLSGKCSG